VRARPADDGCDWLDDETSRAAANASSPPERKEDHMTQVQAFLSDESGVTAIEYALIASLIALIIIVGVQLVGTQVSTMFTEMGNSLK
jgi:pilus assembly protein Flp/PilA